jgi:hypothetical protein
MDKPESIDVKQLAASLHVLLGKDDSLYPIQIESRFPRILENIVSLWGKPEMDAYFDELMVPDRHERQGFPDDVAMEIFHLSTIHAAKGLSATHVGTGWAGIQDAELYRKALRKGHK